MDWQQWKFTYRKELEHIVGYEEMFVDKVLSKLSYISPDDVIPQYHFKDDKGGNRYIDFMIVNKAKGYCLPIELDGYAKMVGNGEQYHKFNDFLERQNAIIQQFGLVLRYSNKKMLNESYKVIEEIETALLNQHEKKSNKELQEQHTKQLIQDYENKIESLKSQQSNSNQYSQEVMGLLQSMQREIHSLKYSPKETVIKETQVTKPVDSNNTIKGIAIGLFALILLGLVFVIFLNVPSGEGLESTSVNSTASNTSSQHTSQYTQNTQLQQTSNPFADSTPTVPTPSKQVTQATESKPVNKIKYVVGESQEVCGKVAQVSSFAKGQYLNLGKPFPKQDISIVVWNGNNLDYLVGKKVCLYGEIKSYKNRLQVETNNVSFIRY